MVCQNQSIDNSDAPLARDLRLLVRERIASGDSDGQVIDFLVARYGDVLLKRQALAAHAAAVVAAAARHWPEADWRCGFTAGGVRRAMAGRIPPCCI